MDLKYYLRGLGVGIVVTALVMGIAASVDSKETLSDDEIRERARALGMVEESTVLADTFAQGNVDSSAGSASEEEEPETVPSPTPDRAEETPAPEEEEASPSPSSAPSAAPSPKATSKPEATPSPKATASPTATPSPKAASEPTAAPSPKAVSEPAATSSPKATASPKAASSPKATSEPEATPSPKATASPAAAVETEDDTSQAESITIQIAGGDSSLTVCKKLAQAGLVESASEYDAYLCQNGYDKRIRAGSFEIPEGAGKEEIAGIILKLK